MNSTTWLVAVTIVRHCSPDPLALIPLLERLGAVDVPNSRSSHSHRALRGGGLAQALGIGFGIILALVMSIHPSGLLAIGLGVLISTALLGWIEDVAGVAVATRAGCQVAIGIVATGFAAAELDRSPLWCLAGGAAVVGLVNVVNFMDGVNLISAAHAVVAGVTFAVLGSQHDAEWLVTLGAILAGSFLAFLPWNMNGRLFLGDTGSYLLGGLAAIIVVMAWMDGVSLVALAAPFVIYVADTGVTLMSRIRAGERWHEAHRDHTYQRLNRAGMSHFGVTLVVATASCATASLGVLFSKSDGIPQVAALSGIFLIAAAYTALRFAIHNPDSSREHRGSA